MTLIGLGLSGFTRRLSIPDVELPFSSNTRRRGNASISLPSSSSSTSSSSTSSSSASESSHTHTSSTSSWIRPSLVPLLGKKYKDDDNYDEYNEDEDEEKYDFFVQSRKRRHHRRSSSSSSFSSFSISNLSYQSKTYLIALLYLFLFGLVLITYIAQNGIQSTINAREALARIQQTLGGRNSNNNSGQSSMNQLAEPKTITTKNRPKMKMVWSDDNKYNTTLPKPFDGFRWTFLHANIMPGEMTINGTISEKLEMLTFVEGEFNLILCSLFLIHFELLVLVNSKNSPLIPFFFL